MTRMITTVLLALLPACAEPGDTDLQADPECDPDRERAESLRVKPVSDSGIDLEVAYVSWRTPGVERWPACKPDADGWFVCGAHLPGPHEVRIVSSGHRTRYATIGVAADDCWDPVTREVELVLESTDCPDDVPAVHVAAIEGEGLRLDIDAYWRHAGTDDPPRACERIVDRGDYLEFACGMNESGKVEVSQQRDGSHPDVVTVPLDEDGCPATQQVEWYIGP